MKSIKNAMLLVFSFVATSGLFFSQPLLAEPPTNSGPYVSRFGAFNWFAFEANGMVAFVGADVPAICQEDYVYGYWDYQIIESPADFDLVMGLAKADDIPVFVYPDSILWDPCGYDDGNMWIVSGTLDAIYTDNDAYAYYNYHSRANSYGVMTHGVLFTQDGDPVNFSGGLRCVFKNNENPDKTWEKCNSRLNLTD